MWDMTSELDPSFLDVLKVGFLAGLPTDQIHLKIYFLECDLTAQIIMTLSKNSWSLDTFI